MRFRFSTADPLQDESDSLPRVPLILRRGALVVEAVGLVDSGATVNILPHDVGIQFGEAWEERKADLRLSGALGNRKAIPIIAIGEVQGLPPVTLAFAWIKENDTPLILGQTNFFMQFDVCFYRSKFEFEVLRAT